MGDKFRQDMRVTLPLVVEAKFEGEEDFQPYLLTDISWGGMFLRMDTPQSVGTALVASFPALDGKECNEIRGRVVTQNKLVEGRAVTGVGVAFENIDQDTKGLIQKLVDRMINYRNQ